MLHEGDYKITNFWNIRPYSSAIHEPKCGNTLKIFVKKRYEKISVYIFRKEKSATRKHGHNCAIDETGRDHEDQPESGAFRHTGKH